MQLLSQPSVPLLGSRSLDLKRHSRKVILTHHTQQRGGSHEKRSRSKFFSRSSEKLSEEDQKQLRLFNEAESVISEEEKNNDEIKQIEVKSHKRKKKGRKPIPPDIPRQEVIHDLNDEEKSCFGESSFERFAESVGTSGFAG